MTRFYGLVEGPLVSIQRLLTTKTFPKIRDSIMKVSCQVFRVLTLTGQTQGLDICDSPSRSIHQQGASQNSKLDTESVMTCILCVDTLIGHTM